MSRALYGFLSIGIGSGERYLVMAINSRHFQSEPLIPQAVEAIFNSLELLGLDWDYEVILQCKRDEFCNIAALNLS